MAEKMSVEDAFKYLDDKYKFIARDRYCIIASVDKPCYDIGHISGGRELAFEIDIKEGEIVERPKVITYRDPVKSDYIVYKENCIVIDGEGVKRPAMLLTGALCGGCRVLYKTDFSGFVTGVFEYCKVTEES